MKILIVCESSGTVRERSKTYDGIAQAMANQWSNIQQLQLL